MKPSRSPKTALLVLPLIVLLAQFLPMAAAQPSVVSGGGTGTFGADLDGDGDIDGSQFGLVASILEGGLAKGHFECLMAGRSDFLGLRLMAVSGRISSGSLEGDGTIILSGIGSVNLGEGELVRGMQFTVTVWPGGPGVGTLQLTVVGAFDGVPGDTALGNGNYDLPPETVVTGHIAWK
jgi:hypothetical protein